MNKKDCEVPKGVATLLGRLFMGGVFAFAGFGKIMAFEGTAGWMASAGLPFASFLLVLTIILELGGGIALVVGYKVEMFAFLLAGFTVLATLIFHTDFSVAGTDLLFMKNIMIVGGLLAFSAFGAGDISVDESLLKK